MYNIYDIFLIYNRFRCPKSIREEKNLMANPAGSTDAPTATFVNAQRLDERNMVYVAKSCGQNLVASNRNLGIGENSSDVFVQTPDGELGIYHANLMRQFREQYVPNYTGNPLADQARQDFAYSSYLTEVYSQKAQDVFSLLRSLPAGKQVKTRSFVQAIEAGARAHAGMLQLSPEATQEYVQSMMFKALGEKFRGNELGERSREAYALSCYGRDTFNFTVAKYGLEEQKGRNPYDRQDPPGSGYRGSSESPQMMLQFGEQVEEQHHLEKALQFMTLFSLFSSAGFFPLMAAGLTLQPQTLS